MKKIQINCKYLDTLLGGGLESGYITEIYGEPGSGKTNFCLQVARECANLGFKVAYVDTEGVSGERLNQMCEGYNYKKILSNILFFNPKSLEEQEKTITQIAKMNDISCVIIDSINKFYRLKVEEDEEAADRSLNRQITDLQLTANEKDMYVVISGQVYSTQEKDVRIFGSKSVERMAKTIIKFEKVDEGQRQATLIRHPTQVMGKKVLFKITNNGLE